MTLRPTRPILAAGIIERHDNHILLVKPKVPVGEQAVWQFPRGLVQPGESAEKGMRRQAREDLGLHIEIVVGQPPYLIEVDDRETELRFFICGIYEEHNVPDVYAELRWIPKIHLKEYDLDAISQPVAEWLLES